MQETFDSAQVSKVIDQALMYQCACPAQVCRAIFELRELHQFQMNCADDTANDRIVHETIAGAAEQAHQLMELCLEKILEIEGWDRATLTMPAGLRKKASKTV